MTTLPNSLFPLIFESINDGVFTVDGDFVITSFNAAAERITGVSRDHAIGNKCHEVFKANICQKRCAMRHTMETGESTRDVRVDVLGVNMEQVPIEVSTAVLRDPDGHMLGGVEIFRDISDVEILRTELTRQHRFGDIIGESQPMRDIFSLIPQVAQAGVPVLIRGPSGTGKELVAEAIHSLSTRKEGPFVRVNCGALPDTLLESELFGYVRGAFTGALANKPGRFAQANGGTLFLDEIGDITPRFQVKLLRALEEGEIQPLGATRTMKVDVQLLCATNRDLESMVEAGQFREDLYYRIRVVPVDMPALVDRRGDIPLLVDHFARLISARTGRPVPGFSPRVMRLLYDYHYPGNVRELRNILERAFVLCPGELIEPGCLPEEVLRSSSSPVGDSGAMPLNADGSPVGARIRRVLDEVAWNRAAAAARLGISRTTLWRQMKRYGLD